MNDSDDDAHRRQFDICLPHTAESVAHGNPVANPNGAGSQLQVATIVGAGDYFSPNISSDGSTIHFDLFDPQHQLLSETNFTHQASRASRRAERRLPCLEPLRI